MNAIRPPGQPRAVAALNRHATQPDPLAARREAALARLRQLSGTWWRSDNMTLHILPDATREERIAMAAVLLADTGARIVTEDA